MARENEAKPKAVPSSPTTEKPLPIPRPGTSGTENLLITNRRQLSEQFQKAQRAEKTYRAKKQASLARNNYNQTKRHFKESFSHLVAGVRGLLAVVRAVPYLVREKREDRRRKTDAARRTRALERKKKLEETLARASTIDGDEEEEEEEEQKKGKGAAVPES